jgi:predicted GH43/DUF377 family glycosyl hydrolase
LGDSGECIVTYTIYNSDGAAIGGATTKDFRHFNELPTLLPPENKNAAVFPRPIDGQWWMLHRPTPSMDGIPAGIWLSSSPDLRYWGHHRPLLAPRPGNIWDGFRVGVGPPPIETTYGWAALYHGVQVEEYRLVYRVGAALLDKDDPWRVLSRPSACIMEPEKNYELVGDKRVIFCNGWVLDESRDLLTLYYGASDLFVCVAHMSWTGFLNHLLS